jgi:hypothetical protein
MLESALIMDAQAFRGSLTDAIRYWEPRRSVYNVVLAAIVFGRAKDIKGLQAADLLANAPFRANTQRIEKCPRLRMRCVEVTPVWFFNLWRQKSSPHRTNGGTS